MKIVSHDYDIPHYTNLTLRLWDSESKEKLDEQVIDNPKERDSVALISGWASRFGEPIYGFGFEGFRVIANPFVK